MEKILLAIIIAILLISTATLVWYVTSKEAPMKKREELVQIQKITAFVIFLLTIIGIVVLWMSDAKGWFIFGYLFSTMLVSMLTYTLTDLFQKKKTL